MKKLIYTLISYALLFSTNSHAIGTWPTPERIASEPSWWQVLFAGWF